MVVAVAERGRCPRRFRRKRREQTVQLAEERPARGGFPVETEVAPDEVLREEPEFPDEERFVEPHRERPVAARLRGGPDPRPLPLDAADPAHRLVVEAGGGLPVALGHDLQQVVAEILERDDAPLRGLLQHPRPRHGHLGVEAGGVRERQRARLVRRGHHAGDEAARGGGERAAGELRRPLRGADAEIDALAGILDQALDGRTVEPPRREPLVQPAARVPARSAGARVRGHGPPLPRRAPPGSRRRRERSRRRRPPSAARSHPTRPGRRGAGGNP